MSVRLESLERSLEGNQLSSPDSGLGRFKLACHWLGAIKEIALCNRGFLRGSQ